MRCPDEANNNRKSREGRSMESFNAKTELLLITPQTAAEMLKNNSGNRPLSQARVDKYSQDMKLGNWKITHQGIAFDNNKRLLDGQHRLEAVVKSGAPVYLNVSHGLGGEIFDVLDTGGNRSKADVLGIAGLPPRIAKIIGATIPYCVTYEMGNAASKSVPKKFGNTNIMTLEYFQANPTIIDSASFVTKMPRRDAIVKESISCFMHHQIRQQGHDDADEFLSQLLTGAEVPSGSAVFEMRKTLIANKIGTSRTIESVIINRIIAAYNIFHKGRFLKDPYQALRRITSGDIVRIA